MAKAIATVAPEAIDKLNNYALCVLLEINRQLNGAERLYINYRHIAERLGLSRETVSNNVDTLIRCGLVTATKEGLSIVPGVIVYIEPFAESG